MTEDLAQVKRDIAEAWCLWRQANEDCDPAERRTAARVLKTACAELAEQGSVRSVRGFLQMGPPALWRDLYVEIQDAPAFTQALCAIVEDLLENAAPAGDTR